MRLARVLVVDDHALFRYGVRNAIEREGDIQVVGEAADGSEALSKAKELHPDLILMDIYMPGTDGLEAVRTIKGELPEVKIVMLTIHDQDENLFEAIKSGAEGFLTKNVRARELVDSLRDVMRGEAAISKPMASKILKEFARLARVETGSIRSQLTSRERQVLVKISEGLSNRKIGLCLRISENTVKVHVASILKKLHLQNRSQAAVYAQQIGLCERSSSTRKHQ